MHYVRIPAGTVVTNPFSGDRGALADDICVEMGTSPSARQARIDAAQTFETHPEMLEDASQADYDTYVAHLLRRNLRQ